MHKSHRFDIKNTKIFWGGGKAPSPDPTPHPLGAFDLRRLDSRAFGASSLNPPIENFFLRH